MKKKSWCYVFERVGGVMRGRRVNQFGKKDGERRRSEEKEEEEERKTDIHKERKKKWQR